MAQLPPLPPVLPRPSGSAHRTPPEYRPWVARRSIVDDLEQFDEARAFLRDRIPEAIRVLGKNHDLTFKLQRMHSQCLFENAGASLEDVTAAIAALVDLDRRQTQVFGSRHPQTAGTRRFLEKARQKLARMK